MQSVTPRSVCLSVCLSDTTVSPTKMAEPIVMPFGMWTLGTKEPCIRWGLISHRKEHFG